MPIIYRLYKAKNYSVALATVSFFNAVETRNNQFICGILWSIWYKNLLYLLF